MEHYACETKNHSNWSLESPLHPWQVIVLIPNDVHVDESRLKILNDASTGVQWVIRWVDRWIWLANDVKSSDAKLMSSTPISNELSSVCRRSLRLARQNAIIGPTGDGGFGHNCQTFRPIWNYSAAGGDALSVRLYCTLYMLHDRSIVRTPVE